MLGALAAVAIGFLGRMQGAGMEFLTRLILGGGWATLPLAAAAAGAAIALGWARSTRERTLGASLALVLALLALVPRPFDAMSPEEHPRTPLAKARAILRWSYRSPATVAKILPLSRDPDPVVREQAMLALGVNLIVSDIERGTPRWPSRHAGHPLRDSLRVRLLEALHDPVEGVRAEAARALWKAPRAFGTQQAAAETLAAILGRARSTRIAERLVWLALDAAAGAPDSSLRRAAAEFATVTPDTTLARVARQAASRR